MSRWLCCPGPGKVFSSRMPEQRPASTDVSSAKVRHAGEKLCDGMPAAPRQHPYVLTDVNQRNLSPELQDPVPVPLAGAPTLSSTSRYPSRNAQRAPAPLTVQGHL